MQTKTSIKKSSRKLTQKKTASTSKQNGAEKETKFRAMVCAQEGECFWTCDGAILKNLADLHLAFGSMGEAVFLHHATKEKNDFANWVEYVLQDSACADALRRAKKVAQAKKVVAEHLRSYTQ